MDKNKGYSKREEEATNLSNASRPGPLTDEPGSNEAATPNASATGTAADADDGFEDTDDEEEEDEK